MRRRACTDATLPTSRDFCKRIEALKGELAVAAEASRLSATIERLKLQIAKHRHSRRRPRRRPQARAITELTGVDVAHVGQRLTWLLALAVEAISAFGLFAITRRDLHASQPATPENSTAWRLVAKYTQAPQIDAAPGWRPLKAG